MWKYTLTVYNEYLLIRITLNNKYLKLDNKTITRMIVCMHAHTFRKDDSIYLLSSNAKMK